MRKAKRNQAIALIFPAPVGIILIIWGIPGMIQDLFTWQGWIANAWNWLTETPTFLSWILVVLGLMILLKPQWLFKRDKDANNRNPKNQGEKLVTLERDILAQTDYDKYHLKERMIVKDERVTSWKLDPVMGGELKFSLEVFNGSVFPSIKVGHAIEGKLMMRDKEFHDKPEIKLPRNSTHGSWLTIVIAQPVLPEVIKEINEGAINPGGIILPFNFRGVKLYAEAEGLNTGLHPQNTLELTCNLKYRVKYEAGLYSWQRVSDISIS